VAAMADELPYWEAYPEVLYDEAEEARALRGE
jgi:hypothetical protein